MKKKLTLFSILVLVVAFAVGGTSAYFTQEETVHNVITTGAVEIELIENFDKEDTWTEGKGDGGSLTYTLDGNVMPGTSFKKEPVIKNTGSEDAYVRFMVEMTITGANGEDLVGYVNPNLYPFIYDPVTSSGDIIRTNHDNWDYDDGWFVYKDALHPGEQIAMFDTVVIDPRMPNAYQGCTVEISVRAQAVQAKNNAPATEGDYSTVSGWPAA